MGDDKNQTKQTHTSKPAERQAGKVLSALELQQKMEEGAVLVCAARQESRKLTTIREKDLQLRLRSATTNATED